MDEYEFSLFTYLIYSMFDEIVIKMKYKMIDQYIFYLYQYLLIYCTYIMINTLLYILLRVT